LQRNGFRGGWHRDGLQLWLLLLKVLGIGPVGWELCLIHLWVLQFNWLIGPVSPLRSTGVLLNGKLGTDDDPRESDCLIKTEQNGRACSYGRFVSSAQCSECHRCEITLSAG